MNAISRRRFLATGAVAALLPPALAARGKPLEPSLSFNPFALSLYKELGAAKGNVFCSPMSISLALGMTAAGAKGTTLSQMQKTLGLGDDAVASDAAFARVAKALDGTGKGYELAVANALWAQPGYPWNPAYTRRMKDSFRAGIQEANYVKDPDAARKAINDWVEKQTKARIKDLMPDGSIDRNTRLVLTNAITFKGDWLKAFDKKDTQKKPFTLQDGKKVEVPLMYRNATVPYAETDAAQIIRLPYKGEEVSFLAALPRKPEKLAELEANLEREVFGQTLTATPDVRVWLPRFKVETAYTLNEPLKALGMPDAFNAGKADFGGMVTGPSELFISLVVHKAFVEVHEEGTEAAAATGVTMKRASAPVKEPKQFRADRPFVFALRHDPTNTLLFVGRYTNPT